MPNNAGKSSLLKFFYEFRDLFAQLSRDAEFQQLLVGKQLGFSLAGVSDTAAVFSNANNRNLVIQFDFPFSPDEQAAAMAPLPTLLTIEVSRNQNLCALQELRTATQNIGTHSQYAIATNGTARSLTQTGVTNPLVSLESMMTLFGGLARTMYLGGGLEREAAVGELRAAMKAAGLFRKRVR